MSTNPETLRDIARIAYDRHGGGGRVMERVLRGSEHRMVYTTFDKILNGTYTSRPGHKTLQALAYLAGIAEDRVYAAAGRSQPKASFAEMLPPDVDELTEEQRHALILTARAFLNANQQIEGLRNERQDTAGSGNVVELRPGGSDDPRAGQKMPPLEELAAYIDPKTIAEAERRRQEAESRGEESQE